MGERERTSVYVRGDAQYSQTREVVESDPGPAVRVIVSEGDRLTRDVEVASEALRMAEELGEYSLIERAEERLTQCVDLLTEWTEAGDQRNPFGDLDYLPLSDALGMTGVRELTPEQCEQRLDDWSVFLRYVFQDGSKNPWAAFKNLLAVVRRVSPQYLDGMSATDVAFLLGETKAAPPAREKTIVEDQLRRWGVRGFHALGGTKSESARKKSAESARGNSNRRKGTRRKKAQGKA